ncbi:MAG TPA: class A beta-lactamase-related serine hydrolase [Gemmatimonadaceae bacterium]|nr:class A beta-lactamase-related serine hydrolase [Gemmatimonadaceae bacterium]
MTRLVLFALLCATSLSAQSSTDSLRERIAARVARHPGALAGVYYRDLGSGEELAWHADSTFHAASTMKVPVMIAYFRGVDEGRFGAGQRVTLANRFRSIVDGSPYALDAGDGSDSALYRRVGEEVAVRELVERMITRSSNLATNVVIELVGAERAQATARSLGASTMMVRRGVEDGLAFRAGLNNTTTARNLGALFEAIGRGAAASGASTRAMLEILERQEFNDEIPAGLPPGTRVAHKTGWITGILHDAALVLPEGRPPFVLVVLTKGIPDEKVAQRLIADIAGMVWAHATAGNHVPGLLP